MSATFENCSVGAKGKGVLLGEVTGKTFQAINTITTSILTPTQCRHQGIKVKYIFFTLIYLVYLLRKGLPLNQKNAYK